MATSSTTVKSKKIKVTNADSKDLTWRQLVVDLRKVCDHAYNKRFDWHVSDLEFEILCYRRSRQMVMAIFWADAPNRDAHVTIDDAEFAGAIADVGSERLNDYIRKYK